MNLFYNLGCPAKNIRKLVRDIRKQNSNIPKRQQLFYGDARNVNNNFLFIQENLPYPTFLKSSDSAGLLSLCGAFDIKNKFLTAANLLSSKSKDKESISKSVGWINLLIEIICPKMIVLLGEYSTLLFSKKKLDTDNYGKIWDFHGDIPIYFTIEVKNYDGSREQHKRVILQDNWKCLQEEYQQRIK